MRVPLRQRLLNRRRIDLKGHTKPRQELAAPGRSGGEDERHGSPSASSSVATDSMWYVCGNMSSGVTSTRR